MSDLDAAKAGTFTTIVLGPVSLAGSQVSMLTTWVNAGGNLVASRPDPQLASLLGLSPAPVVERLVERLVFDLVPPHTDAQAEPTPG